ncbi:MAG: response regulator transcription factor [Herpetosiphonaceae bacterium]|nr:response regulator transcription factor [Herpetosiphonaceae bacterium]
MTSVLVVAPTPALRIGVQALLTAADIEFVGAVATLAEMGADLQRADVVVIADDSLLPDREAGQDEGPAWLVLSSDPSTVRQLRRLHVRAWGIVLPDAPASELHAAVIATAQGLIVLPPVLLEAVASHAGMSGSSAADALVEPLTTREDEVLQLVGQGLSNKQIARQLHISEHTVKFHVSAVYSKLGAVSRADAVSRGARRGLIIL